MHNHNTKIILKHIFTGNYFYKIFSVSFIYFFRNSAEYPTLRRGIYTRNL